MIKQFLSWHWTCTCFFSFFIGIGLVLGMWSCMPKGSWCIVASNIHNNMTIFAIYIYLVISMTTISIFSFEKFDLQILKRKVSLKKTKQLLQSPANKYQPILEKILKVNFTLTSLMNFGIKKQDYLYKCLSILCYSYKLHLNISKLTLLPHDVLKTYTYTPFVTIRKKNWRN